VAEDDDPLIEEGWVSASVRAEHPDLRLCSIAVDGSPGKSPRGLRRRLGELSSRFSGARAVSMRQEPIPHAYRVFYRHIGLDPDDPETRPAVEEAAMRRLMEGGFTSHDHVQDAVLMAIVETGVPLWALDDDRLRGPIGIRETAPRELLGEGPYADEMPPGRLVVADDAGPVAVLFGAIAPGRGPSRETARLRIFALQVLGVPELHLEEALWLCAEALEQP
jgi:DNA/RNA-binding domain of Phe-tRNA-synthetase-like protein